MAGFDASLFLFSWNGLHGTPQSNLGMGVLLGFRLEQFDPHADLLLLYDFE